MIAPTPQNDVAVALAGVANLAEPVDKLAVEPNPDQAILVLG
jgi:hypothetical protein